MNQNDMDLNNVGIVLSRVSPAGSVTVSIPGSWTSPSSGFIVYVERSSNNLEACRFRFIIFRRVRYCINIIIYVYTFSCRNS